MGPSLDRMPPSGPFIVKQLNDQSFLEEKSGCSSINSLMAKSTVLLPSDWSSWQMHQSVNGSEFPSIH
ncbi:hypothetical protein NXS19_012438 [Fusarium pseudograminearum]|nr:hypothetical protein NXS19_012438 [Fusarium pseudograminearum]